MFSVWSGRRRISYSWPMLTDPIRVGGLAIDPVPAALALSGLLTLMLLALVVLAAVGMVRRAREATARTAEVADLKARLQTIAELSVTRQAELARSLNERLDRVGQRVGHDLTETTRKTGDSLAKLHERLAVIDSAQKNLTELSSNVVTLQAILANKQSRGAFGQGRMEAIIEDGLPKGAYAFQVTLSNRTRPDCVIHLPNAPSFVVDAKFPLEGFETLRVAREESARKDALRAIKRDVGNHIDAIARSYLIPGETQDTALMFVPSESIYADLHEYCADLVQKAHRARVVIVSPNMLMLAVQTMQVILRDVKMREQAHLIQKEVAHLMDDVHRLRERTLDLQRHFGQANQDIEKILTSSDKISSRGRRIETLDLEDASQPDTPEAPAARLALKSAPRGDAKPRPPRPAKQPDLLAGE